MGIKGLVKTLCFISAMAPVRGKGIGPVKGIDINYSHYRESLTEYGRLECHDQDQNQKDSCHVHNALYDAFVGLRNCTFLQSQDNMQMSCVSSWDGPNNSVDQRIYQAACTDAVNRFSVGRLAVQATLMKIAIMESAHPLTRIVVLGAGPSYESILWYRRALLVDQDGFRMDAGLALRDAVNEKCNINNQQSPPLIETYIGDMFSLKFREKIESGAYDNNVFIFSAINNQKLNDPFSQSPTFETDLNQLISTIIASSENPVFISHGRNHYDMAAYMG